VTFTPPRRLPLLFSSLLAASLLACVADPAPSVPVVADAVSARRSIEAVLDDWHDAAAKADLQRYFGHLDDDSVFLGTDATERWDKAAFLAYAKPHFAKGKAWTFRAKRREVALAASGDLAWFDEELETAGLGPARGSGVLALRQGRWVIVHYNLTVTVPNDRFGIVKEAAGAAVVLESHAADPASRAGWLAGAWVGRTESGERFEEIWMVPAGGAMVGSGRSTKDDRMVFFEHLRIEAREGRLVYVAQPLGKPPTEFVETPGDGPATLVFENRAHDWPKRIRYERTAKGLAVRVEGDPGQPVDAWTMQPAVIARPAFPAPSR
jgi:ketosteroid isomerase-like protein